MEPQGKEVACAGQAEIAAKAQAYGFTHADVLRALDAAGPPRLAVGDMLAKGHPAEAGIPAPSSCLKCGGPLLAVTLISKCAIEVVCENCVSTNAVPTKSS